MMWGLISPWICSVVGVGFGLLLVVFSFWGLLAFGLGCLKFRFDGSVWVSGFVFGVLCCGLPVSVDAL